METRLMPFVGGPWDGQELPVDVAPNGGLPNMWHMIEERPHEYDIATGPGLRLDSGRVQVRHEYWLTNEPSGRAVYVHQDEREW